MKTFKINLKDEFSLPTSQSPYADCYLIDNDTEVDENRRHPAVVVLPGGGYEFTSFRESEPIALNYVSLGFHAFVLKYSVSPERYPESFLEASALLSLIRKNADNWFIDCDKIAVIGFSAGGHLAACMGTIWGDPIVTETLNIKYGANKPNAVILGYPVISSDEDICDRCSFDALLGKNASNEERETLSLEKRVGSNTVPTFIWQTVDDEGVDVRNSIRFAESLAKSGITFELHLYPHGAHGLANCNKTTSSPDNEGSLINRYVEGWVEQSKRFLIEICEF